MAIEPVADGCAVQGAPWVYRRNLAGWVWLAFLGFPLAELLSARVSWLHLTLVLIGFVACVIAYSALLLNERLLSRGAARGAVFTLFAIGVAMTAYDRVGWATVLVYCCAAMSIRRLFSERTAIALVVGCTGSGVALALARGASPWTAITVAVSCVGVGMLLIVIGQVRARNVELLSAREELARLAVADERLRFARDMHDLLGHSLSVIALKAELVGRLLDRDLDAAAVHIGELETVARGALAEVREAVSGYRQPVLSAELGGARMALQDAGIKTRMVEPGAVLSPEIEALLAWTVREGATNVIRHSDARSCSVVIECGPQSVSAEVTDDGRGPRQGHDGVGRSSPQVATEWADGHGLAGLRERAERLAGHLDAGVGPNGGFRLSVTVPTQAAEPAS